MPHATDFRAVPFELLELKESRDAWSFTGYASTFGNVDLGGDVVLPGAFSESLKDRPKPRLLWHHQQDEPIGVVESLKEDERGLLGTWKLSRTSRGQDAHTLLKDGAIDSLSIGFIPEESEFTDDGIRKLKSIDLLEISLVSMPMNEEAVVTAVKAQLSAMPFAASCKRLAALLDHGVAEAKALRVRRASDKRELSDVHISAVDEVLEQAEAWIAELKALRERDATPPAPSQSVRGDPAEVDPSTLSITQLRLRIAHKRMQRGALLEHAHA